MEQSVLLAAPMCPGLAPCRVTSLSPIRKIPPCRWNFPWVQKDKRAADPLFDAVIEVEGGRQPMWTVVNAVAKVVDELLANGSVAKPDRRTPLPPGAILQEVCPESAEARVSFGEN